MKKIEDYLLVVKQIDNTLQDLTTIMTEKNICQQDHEILETTYDLLVDYRFLILNTNVKEI